MAYFKSSIKKYLKYRERKPISALKIKRLGAGWHGEGYEITYNIGTKKKSVILRTQRPVDFSHDFPSDRAKVFLLQHGLFCQIPKHVRSIDVCGMTSAKEIISLGKAKEFYQIVDRAEGIPYMEDLERIKKIGKLINVDESKALDLSNYLIKLHGKKFKGSKKQFLSIKKRHLRDTVGHGEMLMGVLDTYPEKISWATKKEITELICKAVRFEQSIKNLPLELSKMHGDFHPGNIWFKKNRDFVLLDASRELWGLSADDVTTLAINYIWFALMHIGKFGGPFRELFEIFWKNYMRKTKDKSVAKTAALFFAFRGMVVAHPVFYKNQSNQVRRKIFNFINNALEDKVFDFRKINSYLR